MPTPTPERLPEFPEPPRLPAGLGMEFVKNIYSVQIKGASPETLNYLFEVTSRAQSQDFVKALSEFLNHDSEDPDSSPLPHDNQLREWSTQLDIYITFGTAVNLIPHVGRFCEVLFKYLGEPDWSGVRMTIRRSLRVDDDNKFDVFIDEAQDSTRNLPSMPERFALRISEILRRCGIQSLGDLTPMREVVGIGSYTAQATTLDAQEISLSMVLNTKS